MDNLIENKSDTVILLCENEEFVCSKFCLVQSSHYFRAMFDSVMIESSSEKIRLHDVPVNSLRILINFALSKELPRTSKNYYDLLRAACMLQFDAVREHCIQHLLCSLDVTNCLSLWELADTLSVQELRFNAKRLALWEGSTILKEITNLTVLPSNLLKELIEHDGLRVESELQVFNAIRIWCQQNDSWDEAADLLPLIRYSELSPYERTQIENDPLVVQHNHLVRCIKENMQESPTGLTLHPRKVPLTPILVGAKLESTPQEPDIVFYAVSTNNDILFHELTTFKLEWLHKPQLIGYGVAVIGRHVFLFGGEEKVGSGKWNRETWKYDVFNCKWETAACIPQERRHFVQAVCNGKLYVAGGFGKFRIILTSMICYDPESDRWEDCIAVPHSALSAALVSVCGQLYFFSTEVYLYNPVLNAWELVQNDPTYSCVSCAVGSPSRPEVFIWDNQIHELLCYNVGDKTVRTLATVNEDVQHLSLLDDRIMIHSRKGFVTFDLQGQMLSPFRETDILLEKTSMIPWYQSHFI